MNNNNLTLNIFALEFLRNIYFNSQEERFKILLFINVKKRRKFACIPIRYVQKEE